MNKFTDKDQIALSLFGANVKAERTRQNLTTVQLAKLAGISDVAVWKIENGRQSTGLVLILALANALKIPVEQLVKGIS